MSQLVSQPQKISAIILSISLCASAVFAYHKQHPPITSFRQPKPVEYVPRFDAAYQAARDAEQNSQPDSIEVTRQAVFDAAVGSLEAAPTPEATPIDAHDLATQEDTLQDTQTTPFNLSNRSEVHMIGVYEADDGETEPWWAGCGHTESESLACFEEMKRKKSLGGPVEVTVDYPNQPVVLILTAYDPVQWNIKITPSTKIEQLIIAGYHAQSYRGVPNSTPVATYTHYHSTCSTACWRGSGYFYIYDLSKDSTELQQKVHEITGKQIYSFQGAYKGKTFNIYSGIPKIRYQTANPS